MKRILLIGHSSDMYGASRSLNKLARILSEEYEVFVLLPESGELIGALSAHVPEKQIIVYKNLFLFTRKAFRVSSIFATGLSFIRNVAYLSAIVRRHKIDLIHTNTGVVPAPALAAKLSGIKHIWHIREWFGDFKSFWPVYRRYMLRFSDRIICVSNTVATQFAGAAKVLGIYNGFDIPENVPPPIINEELRENLRHADLVLGCTSRIRLVRKGQEYLIQAVGELSKRTGKNIHIVLVGDFVPGYEEQKLTLASLIEKYSLRGRVHFIGHVADALPYYSLFDIFVLPSGEPEPFGGVVMEAMSAGLPIIGSNGGGTDEQIADGANGYIFESRNPADLADKIEKFLIDTSLAERLGSESKERMLKLFSLAVHKRNILRLYAETFKQAERV